MRSRRSLGETVRVPAGRWARTAPRRTLTLAGGALGGCSTAALVGVNACLIVLWVAATLCPSNVLNAGRAGGRRNHSFRYTPRCAAMSRSLDERITMALQRQRERVAA